MGKLPRLDAEARWGAFAAAESFVLPSHQENFGIAVAEALSCGTPALISDKVNIWREVEAGGAGIVAPDTLEGACALLQTWKEMPVEQQREMRRRARECFLRQFEVSNASRTLVRTLSNIIAGKEPHAGA